MRLVLGLQCLHILSVFVASQNNWQPITNHDEEVFINLQDNVSSWEEARKACENMSSINLVLWRKSVLDFTNNLLNDSKYANISIYLGGKIVIPADYGSSLIAGIEWNDYLTQIKNTSMDYTGNISNVIDPHLEGECLFFVVKFREYLTLEFRAMSCHENAFYACIRPIAPKTFSTTYLPFPFKANISSKGYAIENRILARKRYNKGDSTSAVLILLSLPIIGAVITCLFLKKRRKKVKEENIKQEKAAEAAQAANEEDNKKKITESIPMFSSEGGEYYSAYHEIEPRAVPPASDQESPDQDKGTPDQDKEKTENKPPEKEENSPKKVEENSPGNVEENAPEKK